MRIIRLVNNGGRRGASVETGSSAAVEDLTARVRHPRRWMLRHPLRAARRRHLRVAVTLTLLGILAGCLAIKRRQAKAKL